MCHFSDNYYLNKQRRIYTIAAAANTLHTKMIIGIANTIAIATIWTNNALIPVLPMLRFLPINIVCTLSHLTVGLTLLIQSLGHYNFIYFESSAMMILLNSSLLIVVSPSLTPFWVRVRVTPFKIRTERLDIS